MTTGAAPAQAPQSYMDVYVRVIHALMLRDMRSRFMGSYWGYLVQVLWPVVHVLAIVAIMTYRNLPSPMGDSTMLFIATGVFPLLAFKYISREMMKGHAVHKTLTYFPQVKGFDTIVARGLVEIVGSFLGLGVVFVFLLACGVDPVPVDIGMAITGYLAAMALGIAFGIANVSIAAIFPAWQIIYILFAIVLYMASGVLFMACYLPEEAYEALRWNPLVHIIEWVRLGYEPNLPIEIDYFYVLNWIFGSLCFGLLMERTFVRKQHH